MAISFVEASLDTASKTNIQPFSHLYTCGWPGSCAYVYSQQAETTTSIIISDAFRFIAADSSVPDRLGSVVTVSDPLATNTPWRCILDTSSATTRWFKT